MSGPVAVPTTDLPWLVQVGESQHGVARYAGQLADAVAGIVVDPGDGNRAVSLAEVSDGRGGRAHLHFTDRMWGANPEAAADAIERLAAAIPISVTLHDLPQASDGQKNLPRRIECYARVVAAATGVVCNSRHEALLLAEYVDAGATPVVIHLPVDIGSVHGPVGPLDNDVALVGFFYPGKGHGEAVDAVAQLNVQRPGVVALGRASPGHDQELTDLELRAETQGVRFSATGFLDDDDLLERCRRAGVPLAAHQHVSASGSLATWISAGRRPLVPDTRYSREMAQLRPGTVTLYSPDTLAESISVALGDPASTWWDADASTGPDTDEVARQYVAWWATLPW